MSDLESSLVLIACWSTRNHLPALNDDAPHQFDTHLSWLIPARISIFKAHFASTLLLATRATRSDAHQETRTKCRLPSLCSSCNVPTDHYPSHTQPLLISGAVV
jgi:hypothetical protein